MELGVIPSQDQGAGSDSEKPALSPRLTFNSSPKEGLALLLVIVFQHPELETGS